MADPISSAAAAAAASSPGMTVGAAAAASVLLQMLGVDAQLIAAALAGTVLRVAASKPAGEGALKTAARVAGAVLGSAYIGAGMGEAAGLARLATAGTTVLAAALLHVGIEWATRRFGSLADAGAKRLGVDINEEASK